MTMVPINSSGDSVTLDSLRTLLDPIYAGLVHSHAISDVTNLTFSLNNLQSQITGETSRAIAAENALSTAVGQKAEDSVVVKLTGAQTVAGGKNFTAVVGSYVGIGMMNGANDAIHSQYGFYNNNNGMMRFGFVGADLSLNSSTCIEMWAIAGNYGKLTGDWRCDTFMVHAPYLCATTAGAGDVRLQCTKSGNGADQALYLMANRYAQVGTPPRIEMAGKEVYIGAYTDGSTSHSFADFNHGYEVVIRKSLVLGKIKESTTDPTATDIPIGFAADWYNTSTGVKKRWFNVTGTPE